MLHFWLFCRFLYHRAWLDTAHVPGQFIRCTGARWYGSVVIRIYCGHVTVLLDKLNQHAILLDVVVQSNNNPTHTNTAGYCNYNRRALPHRWSGYDISSLDDSIPWCVK